MEARSLLRLLLLALISLAFSCSESPTGDDIDDDDTDRTAPATVTDLHIVSITTHTVTLGWTAPGDDDTVGFAMAYDFRGSLDSITATNFEVAIQADSIFAPGPPGCAQEFVVEDLDPDQTYFFALKTRDEAGNFSGLSNCCRAYCPPDVIISFPDTAFERVIREHIDKPAGDIVSSDLDTITEIVANNQHISDLTGIEHAINLIFLHAKDNSISDLAPLANLTSLWGLGLGNNQLTDISSLAGLVGLNQLTISFNPITDLSPLVDMTHLSYLRLDSTAVTDISPIFTLAELQTLGFGYNDASDISFLSGHFPDLKILMLNNNNINDLSALAAHTTLEELSLQVNHNLADLTPLQNLVNLTVVNLAFCNITDLQPLIDNTGLGSGVTVHLVGNTIPDPDTNPQVAALRAKGVDVVL